MVRLSLWNVLLTLPTERIKALAQVVRLSSRGI
jgi:hypothetical protein